MKRLCLSLMVVAVALVLVNGVNAQHCQSGYGYVPRVICPTPMVVPQYNYPPVDYRPSYAPVQYQPNSYVDRYLVLRNNNYEHATIYLQYRTGYNGAWTWLPGAAGSEESIKILVPAGKSLAVSINGNRISASRIRIWGSYSSGGSWGDRNRDLWLVSLLNNQRSYFARDRESFTFVLPVSGGLGGSGTPLAGSGSGGPRLRGSGGSGVVPDAPVPAPITPVNPAGVGPTGPTAPIAPTVPAAPIAPVVPTEPTGPTNPPVEVPPVEAPPVTPAIPAATTTQPAGVQMPPPPPEVE